ncbi:MAG: TetR/AcrR family transcriptional regulator [Cyclobacteriaceae bacterium]|nr:TetR/AcrR family transcriptional regulator [Cyclobacteriaceae bacterium]
MVNAQKHSETAQKILEAAHKVFVKKGMYGARMQEIADEAGINKALLHYYFRSKALLFDAIFQKIFSQFLPGILQILEGEQNFEEKIKVFVGHYLDQFVNNKYLPVFIVNEIHQNPQRLYEMGQALRGLPSSRFITQLKEGIEAGKYLPVTPEHFMMNMISLTIFPVLASPVLTEIFSMDSQTTRQFFEDRKKIVPEMILNSISTKKIKGHEAD